MHCCESIQFVFPVHGDLLNEYDGVETDTTLTVPVTVEAQDGADIYINGVKADCKNKSYTAKVALDGYFNRIEAVDRKNGLSKTISVIWIKKAGKKYNIAVDDVIWAFRDIYQHQDTYQSIFDNPYLAMFKRLHDDFGTITHLNLFFETDGFNLTMFPDKYKQEWEDNADWLTLSFHAKGEFPDDPYAKSSYEQVLEECKQVEQEIVRFAGTKVFNETTGMHWGSPNIYGSRALRSLGMRAMIGYLTFWEGQPYVSHYLTASQVLHAEGRDFWKDMDEDIIFVKDDLILNLTEKEDVIPLLEQLKANPHTGGYIQLLNHEQYYYEDYMKYQSDYEEKMRMSAQWMKDNGYTPARLEDIVFEKRK